ncbi:unnamed protein product [Caenorhabditis brenneri]
MGLVDYAGSDSDSDAEVEQTQKKTHNAIRESLKPDEESYFGEHDEEKGNYSVGQGQNNEDDLEEIVKPKSWEIKLAEKARRKLEKKALKKAQKLETKKERKAMKEAKKANKIAKIGNGIQKDKKKIVISALGALGSIAAEHSSDESDYDEKEEPKEFNKRKTQHGLLSNLPAPKGRDNRSGGTDSFASLLIPHSVATKTTIATSVPSVVKSTLVAKTAEESDDDDDEPTDFFGFSLAPTPKVEKAASDIPFMAMNSSMDIVGPSRPNEEDEIDPSQMYQIPEDEEGQQSQGPSSSEAWLHRKITDEQAHKLLMRFSHDIGSEERRSINEMANSIVDVNVDDALGPDVKTNIIKNLGHRAFVEATSAPIPQVQTQGQTSRRKHQITYLASLAVAREEQLKDQWAEQKQSKRMARQKYGF